MLPNKFFTEEELTGGVNSPIFHDNFLYELYSLRNSFDQPMIVTSCARDPEYNEKIGGHPRSLHLTSNPHHPTNGCMAIDISTSGKSSEYKDSLENVAVKYGWSVGISDTFIHLDRRADIGLKPIVWYY